MRLSRRRTGSWAQLKDNACETHNANDWPRTNPTRKSGVGTRRQIAAIGWERARLPPWSDESARRTVIEVGTKPKSRFMAFTSMLSGSVRPWEVFLHRQASFFRCPATGIRSYWAGSLERFQETSDQWPTQCFADFAAIDGRAGLGSTTAIGIKLKTL